MIKEKSEKENQLPKVYRKGRGKGRQGIGGNGGKNGRGGNKLRWRVLLEFLPLFNP
jgi:hypothetical protein